MSRFLSNSNSGANTLTIDTTHEGVTPIKFTHSNNYLSTDTYGSGSVCIQTTGITNNQPNLIIEKNNSDNTLTNATNLVLTNNGNNIATSLYNSDIELDSNNSAINAYNGKSKIIQLSGINSGTANLRDGYLTINPRNPSNTSYESIFRFLPATTVGTGLFETSGNGISISPIRDFTVGSKFELINAFQNTTITNKSTLAGKRATIENISESISSIQSISRASNAEMIIQSDTTSAYLDIRSNWVSGGGIPNINLYNNSSFDGFRLDSSTVSGFRIHRLVTGAQTNVFSIDLANNGMATFTRTSNQKDGWIRLGNGTGVGGVSGGTILYNNDTTNAVCTLNLVISNGDVRPNVNNSRDVGTPTFQWARMHSLAYLTISDRNKKEDIESLSLGLDFLNEVNTYKYKVKESNKKSLGVIAQDMETVCNKYNIPEGIIYHKQDDNYSVAYLEFIPIIINAIKELSQQIKAPKVAAKRNKK